MLLRQRFRRWRQGRPFWGSLLTIVAGLELYMSGRLQLGGLSLQLGFAGMQTTILPLVLVVLGVLVMVQPVHHLFYGVIALIVSVYSLVAVNLGGFVVGTLLGVAGGVVVVSWMGTRAAEPAPPMEHVEPAETPAPETAGLALLFDDGPRRDPYEHRWSAVALAVTLAAGGVTGAMPAESPCVLGFILCDDDPTTPEPSASPSPSESLSPSADPSPDPSPSDVPTSTPVGPVPSDAVTPTPSGSPSPTPTPAPSEAAPGVAAEVPPELPLPPDEGLPVMLGGNEDIDVYAVPAELKASDLEISGIRAVTLVSVPVGNGTGERRNALKVVADHVLVTGFQLRTYAAAGDRAAGTETTADRVSMDGTATMYITSLSATGPDGEVLEIDADSPPPTLTSLVLAALNPTVGLLGATSESQVWSGFHEGVWAD